eukprot:SAG31_NODE_206_length_20335_cov_17.910160_11_plen_199_part_00
MSTCISTQNVVGSQAGLQRVAAQLVGIYTDVEGAKFAKRLARAIPSVIGSLEHGVTCIDKAQRMENGEAGAEVNADDSEDAVSTWQNMFHSLRTVEKLFLNGGPAVAAAVEQPVHQPLWDAIVRLLGHPHFVRLYAFLSHCTKLHVTPFPLRSGSNTLLRASLAWHLRAVQQSIRLSPKKIHHCTIICVVVLPLHWTR